MEQINYLVPDQYSMQWSFDGEKLLISIPFARNMDSNKDKPLFLHKRREEFEKALESASAFKNEAFQFDLETNTAVLLSRMQMPKRPINSYKARTLKQSIKFGNKGEEIIERRSQEMTISMAEAFKDKVAALRRYETSDTPEYYLYQQNMQHYQQVYNHKLMKMPESSLLRTSPKSNENIKAHVLTFEQFMTLERENDSLRVEHEPIVKFDISFFVLIQSAMLKRELKDDKEESLAKFFLYNPDKRDDEKLKYYGTYLKEVEEAFELIKKSIPYARFAKEVFNLCEETIFKSWQIKWINDKPMLSFELNLDFKPKDRHAEQYLKIMSDFTQLIDQVRIGWNELSEKMSATKHLSQYTERIRKELKSLFHDNIYNQLKYHAMHLLFPSLTTQYISKIAKDSSAWQNFDILIRLSDAVEFQVQCIDPLRLKGNKPNLK